MGKSEKIVDQYVKAYEKRNQEIINSFLDSKYFYYPPGGGKPMSREERIRDEAFFFSAFSKIRTRIVEKVVEGNKMACRITMRCTHSGDYQGVAATNKRVKIIYMEILLMKHGKILKEWAEFDLLSILNQLKLDHATQQTKS